MIEKKKEGDERAIGERLNAVKLGIIGRFDGTTEEGHRGDWVLCTTQMKTVRTRAAGTAAKRENVHPRREIGQKNPITRHLRAIYGVSFECGQQELNLHTLASTRT